MIPAIRDRLGENIDLTKEVRDRLRKPVGQKTKDLCNEVIKRHFNSSCPVCRKTKLFNAQGLPIEDVTRGKFVGDYDHFNGRTNNQMQDVWLVCHECHDERAKLGSDLTRLNRAFEYYQDMRKHTQEELQEELKAEKKRSKPQMELDLFDG
jgi:hypothetical protein